MAYDWLMVFIETNIFTRLITELMSDEEYQELQKVLISSPDMGNVIKASGGLRKVRWKLQGKGKSGGVRVIYYWVVNNAQIRMLYVYPKGKQENLSIEQVRMLKKIIEVWSDE